MSSYVRCISIRSYQQYLQATELILNLSRLLQVAWLNALPSLTCQTSQVDQRCQHFFNYPSSSERTSQPNFSCKLDNAYRDFVSTSIAHTGFFLRTEVAPEHADTLMKSADNSQREGGLISGLGSLSPINFFTLIIIQFSSGILLSSVEISPIALLLYWMLRNEFIILFLRGAISNALATRLYIKKQPSATCMAPHCKRLLRKL